MTPLFLLELVRDSSEESVGFTNNNEKVWGDEIGATHAYERMRDLTLKVYSLTLTHMPAHECTHRHTHTTYTQYTHMHTHKYTDTLNTYLLHTHTYLKTVKREHFLKDTDF